MRVKQILRAAKTAVTVGPWSTGRIPYSSFPMAKAKSKAFKYGPAYRWRLVEFDALGVHCRVMILFNYSKQIFRATLGVELPGGMVIAADHEWHQNEPGWHCHVFTGNVSEATSDARRRHMNRWPAGVSGEGKCVGSESEAFQRAMSFFRITAGSGDLV